MDTAISWRLSAVGGQLSAVSCRLSAIGCWVLAISASCSFCAKLGCLAGLCGVGITRFILVGRITRIGSQDRNLFHGAEYQLAPQPTAALKNRGTPMKTLMRTSIVALAAMLVLSSAETASAQSRSRANLLTNFAQSRAHRAKRAAGPVARRQAPRRQAAQPTQNAETPLTPGIDAGVVAISDAPPLTPGSVTTTGFFDRLRGPSDNGCCDSGCCDSGCCGCDGCCGAPWWSHRTQLFGEFLYLSVDDADVHHAIQQNGTGGAGTVPFGVVGRTDPDWEPGFRVGAARCLNDCASIIAAYTFYESNAISGVTPPVVPGGGGAVGSMLHHPGAAITASNGPVSAFYDVDFQLGDLAIRRIWRSGADYAINWTLGGRYGHLEQAFGQSGIFSGGSAGQINTRTNVDFDGAGLRFGIDGERRFGCRGMSLYANANIAPMLGTVQADYTMQNVSTNVLLAQSTWKDDRFIAMLDYEAGFAWTSATGRWRLVSGYRMAHWFNAVTTDSFVQGVQAGNYADIDGGLSFNGAVSRIELRY